MAVLARTSDEGRAVGTRTARLTEMAAKAQALHDARQAAPRPPAGPDPFAPDADETLTLEIEAPTAEPDPVTVTVRRVSVSVSRKISKDYKSTEYSAGMEADVAGLSERRQLDGILAELYDQCRNAIRAEYARNLAQAG